MSAMTGPQMSAVLAAVPLVGRFGGGLADFERELVEDMIGRVRDQGDRAVMTDREWVVVQEAVGGLEALADDAARDAMKGV